MSALGDGFRKHPIALTIFGGFFASCAIGLVMEPFNSKSLPESLDCVPATANAPTKRGETLVTVSQRNSDVPTYLICKPD